MTTRDDIAELFDSLRKCELFGKKLTARMNFSCCSSCGGYELASELPPKSPVVFYHHQDDESFEDGVLTRPLMLRFGATHKNGSDVVVTPNEDAAVGHLVAAVAMAQGLSVSWGGNPHKCVEILPTPDR
jgi:hypothetical protein